MPASSAVSAAARTPTRVRALWFDGQRSLPQPVLLHLLPGKRGPDVQLTTRDRQTLRVPHAHIGWPESWAAPERAGLRALTLDLQDHGSVQIDDIAAWQAALAAAGQRRSLAERMQTQLGVLAAVALLAVAGVWALHRWGTPWAATQLAAHVPLRWEQALTDEALQQLDTHMLTPSKLPAARQQALRQDFAQLAGLTRGLPGYAHYHPPLKLEFRGGMPPNAFAMPGGTIVMTDAMVRYADRHMPAPQARTALLGVLAHEIGHIQHRHSTRMVIEQGVLQIGLGMLLGDVSALVTSGAALLTGLHYQRGHEVQADCYALAMLQKAGQPAAPLAELLTRLDREGPGSDAADDKDKGATPPLTKPTPEQESETHWGNWLSTHPATAGRARRLTAPQPGDC